MTKSLGKILIGELCAGYNDVLCTFLMLLILLFQVFCKWNSFKKTKFSKINSFSMALGLASWALDLCTPTSNLGLTTYDLWALG